MQAREVGRVVALWRYPVKSMAPEALEEADVGWHGVAGDRRWAFVRAGSERSGFPWLTIRELTEMRAYRPAFIDPARPEQSRTVVRTPSGDEHDVADPALAAELGDGVRVIKQKRGAFDSFPLSLMTTQSVAAAGALVDAPLDPQRFRPNLLVEARGGEPFQEEAWLGHTLRVGGMRMRVDEHDERCVIVNVDPATIERGPDVLKALGRERGGRLGVYGSTVQPGTVRVGDRVSIDV